MFNEDNSLNFSNVVPFIKMLSPAISNHESKIAESNPTSELRS